jgi:hypothetical protein
VAEVTSKVCDACGSKDSVDTLMVVYHYGTDRPWEVDMCQKCYDTRFADLIAKSRPGMRVNTRPQYRLVKTSISPENL